MCKEHFYQGAKDDPAAIHVCKPCACNEAEVMDKNIPFEQVGGDGRVEDNFLGSCLLCKCNISGTLSGDVTCDQYSGQCKCKPNFTCLQCDHCNLGFKLQTILGVESCTINSSQYCDKSTGQCFCKPFVKCQKCNIYISHKYNLRIFNLLGCQDCDPLVTLVSIYQKTCTDLNGLFCRHDSSVTGKKLDKCIELFIGFDPETGRYLQLPYPMAGSQTFVDNSLLPYPSFSYHIVASKLYKSTSSDNVFYRTKAGTPVGGNYLYYFKTLRLMLSTADDDEYKVIYEGLDNFVTLYNLLPFTKYLFSVQVCTTEGCLQSLLVTLVVMGESDLFHFANGRHIFLSHDAAIFSPIEVYGRHFCVPYKLNVPRVHGINSTTMKVSWAPPVFLNGPFPTHQLERIEPALNQLYQGGIKIQFRTKEPDGLILCAVSAGMQEELIALQIRNGRPYFLFDPQSAGCSEMPHVLCISTLHEVPEEVQPPTVETLPYSLHLQWIRSKITIFIAQLPPDYVSPPILIVLDPTKIFVQYVDAYTQESEPEGNILLHVIIDGPRGVQLKWQGPRKPNAQITYSILDKWNVLYKLSQESKRWIFISAPDGVLPPRLSSASPTSLQVVWSTPAHNDAPGLPNYQLQMRPMNPTNEIIELYPGPSSSIILLINHLQPFTPFKLRITTSNTSGETKSNWTTMFTKQDQTRQYELLRRKILQLLASNPPEDLNLWQNIYSVTQWFYEDKDPNTKYQLYLQTFNRAHSINRDLVDVQMLDGEPKGISPPEVTVINRTAVLVIWTPLSNPNGILTEYYIYGNNQIYKAQLNIPQSLCCMVCCGTEYINSSESTCCLGSIGKFKVHLKPHNQATLKCCETELISEEKECCHGLRYDPTLYVCSSREPEELSTEEEKCHTRVLCVWSNPYHVTINESVLELYWSEPESPNGIISQCRLIWNGEVISLRSGEYLNFTDVGLQPNSRRLADHDEEMLVYRWLNGILGPDLLTRENSPASTSHPVQHFARPPSKELEPPSAIVTGAYSEFLTWNPPVYPDGMINYYHVIHHEFFGGEQSFSSSAENTLTFLLWAVNSAGRIPSLWTYCKTDPAPESVGVEVCTCLKCCSRGPMVQLTTNPAPPSHQRPPRITHTTSRSASFEWKEPESPNGIIEGYEVYMQTLCPAQVGTCIRGAPEVKCRGIEKECNVTDLQPYTHYSVHVISHNAIGSRASEWIGCVTHKENPTFTRNVYVSRQSLYSGFDSSVYLQRNMDNTLFFEVTCTTDVGTVSSPIIKFKSATGVAPSQPFPSAKNGTEARGKTFYTELWFIILMALLVLLLLAIFLSLVLRKKINKQPYPRERPPLVPVQPRMSPSSAYTQHETYACDLVADLSGSTNCITLKSYTAHSEGFVELKVSELETNTTPNTPVLVRKPSQISHSFSQNSLYRGASQFISSHDEKSLADGSLWDNALQGHDSGM
ncbi:hypothetical protein XELAEV_18028675mg, partial [Xenopus laevis]